MSEFIITIPTTPSSAIAPKTKQQTVDIIIVEKSGYLKMLQVKDFKEEDLFKKCGFKKPDGFSKQTEWLIKMEGTKYYVDIYAKCDGKANSENK